MADDWSGRALAQCSLGLRCRGAALPRPALCRQEQTDAFERRWRTQGAWLLSLSLLVSLCVLVLGAAIFRESVIASLLWTLPQVVTIHRMASDAIFSLREGASPPLRPVRKTFAGMRAVGSVGCRVATVVSWIVCLVLCSKLGILLASMSSALAPSIVAGILWGIRSIFEEVRAPNPVLADERPIAF